MTLTQRRINHDINVEKYRLIADTDSQAVQRAINMAIAAATPKRIILPIEYTYNEPLDLNGLSGVIIEASGPDGHPHQSSVGMTSLFKTTGACSDILMRGFNFQGTGVDTTGGIPRRSRTWGATGMGTAVTLYGDLYPQARLLSEAKAGATTLSIDTAIATGSWWVGGEAITVTSVTGSSSPYTANLASSIAGTYVEKTFVTVPWKISNFRMEHIKVQNVIWASTPEGSPTLPILFSGLRGEVEIEDYRGQNTYDAGFTFNEFVKVNRFESIDSADNGISVSRGNQRAHLSNIDTSGSCYWGIWVAGFNTDIGPTRFLVDGFTAKDVGYGGITADGASKHGTIVNYDMDLGYHRGPSDKPTDSYGCGIYIGGIPAGSSTPTDFAEDIAIGVGRIGAAPRAGVIFQNVKDVSIVGAHIHNVGTEKLADGVTTIEPTDGNNNIGILVLNAINSFGITAAACEISDWRATPLMNYQMRPGSTYPTANGWNSLFNYGQSGRNTYDILDYTSAGAGARTLEGVTTFGANSKFRGGATAGTNTASGTVVGWDVNGAAGSTRESGFQTAGSYRWKAVANSTAEGGSNAGSDYEFLAYSDAGALLGTAISIQRSTGKVTFPLAPWGYGYPYTVDPGAIRSGDTMAVPAANTAIFLRVREGGTISKVGLSVGTQSGNISVAAYANSGAGRAGVPGERLASSGAIACPAVGFDEISLGATIKIYPGDWLCITADNTVAKFVTLLSTGADNNLGVGRQFREATAHPAPTTPASLVGTIGYDFVLVGI